MPFTLSHPAAVIPFFGVTKHPVYVMALVVGSLSPDFAYYVRAFPVAAFAHSLPGSLLVCLPSSVMVLAVVLMLRRRILFLLPSRHRKGLASLFCAPVRWSFAFFGIICFWAWIGSLSPGFQAAWEIT